MKIYSLEKIETPRLIIRPIKLGDEIALNKAVNNSIELLQKWFPWAKDPTLDATKKFIAQAVMSWQNKIYTGFPMAILSKDNHKIIGGSGYNEHSDIASRIYEIGYWCDIDYQGKGLITECVNALTQYALKELIAKAVILRIDINNLKSIAVAERLNFKNKEKKKNRDKKDSYDHIFTCSNVKDLPSLKIFATNK